jgi:hypothetical protein
MTTFYRSVAIVGVAFAINCVIHAQQPTCSATQSNHAEQEADTLRTWDGLYKSYVSYSKCDDGGISEGYSESVARILVDHWNTLPRLAYFIKRDPTFRHFVLKHVDATLDTADLKKVRALTNTKCPAGLISLCIELRRQSDIALKQIGKQ